MTPASSGGSNGPECTPNAAEIREQSARLLAHPLFTNSKRYPVFLAHVVEQALLGNAEALKERTIGVEAFGRKPDYDVTLDPVVRTTAAEVRKRLVQYYYSPDHAGELVVELSVGSYVPRFRKPATPDAEVAAGSAGTRPGEAPASDPAPSPGRRAETSLAPSASTSRSWARITVASVLAAFVGFGVGRVEIPQPVSNLDRFWKPITTTSARVTYCLGEPAHSVDSAPRPTDPGALYGDLDVSDVVTLARSLLPLVPHKGAFRVVAASKAGFEQLREGPFVLIGAYDNDWTMRLTRDLPFGFEYGSQVRRLVERKNARRSWSVQFPNAKLERDYGVVARIRDRVTGQPVIILAGILAAGTEAAGEVVSNPVFLDAMLQKAPKDWDRMNLEAVIETDVIDGHAGPPRVLAVETW